MCPVTGPSTKQSSLLEMHDDQAGHIAHHKPSDIVYKIEVQGNGDRLDAIDARVVRVFPRIIPNPAVTKERGSPPSEVIKVSGRPRVEFEMNNCLRRQG